MRTPDEIILFLVKRATPDAFLPVKNDREQHPDLPPVRPLHDLLLRLAGTTRYTVPLDDFEVFLGEPFDFERHLRAVHEEGALRFQVAEPGSFYDSPSYRRTFAKSNGCVRNYDTDKSYVAFRVRSCGDDALAQFDEILKCAEALGLKIEPCACGECEPQGRHADD